MKSGYIASLLLGSILLSANVFANDWDWAYQKAQSLVSQLTLEEKCGLMARNSKAVPRLGIPPHDWWNEALHGVARNGKATQFPQAICLASTWDPTLLQEITCAIADEARAKHHSAPRRNTRYHGLTIWSPTINMARDPRWGRTEETYGEDPFLAGRMAAAFVKGLQGNDHKWLKTAATVKHFVANNSEYNRFHARYPVPQRDLREFYLPAFRAAVEDADVASIMTAYNGINGVPCSVNKWLITDVLKNTWGFNGAVVTDAGAGARISKSHHYTKSYEESAAAMIKAGVDCISDPNFGRHIKSAIEQGLMTEKDVDKALLRNLAVRARLGHFNKPEDCPYSKIPMSVVGSETHRELARQAAREGIVLLKNSPSSDNKAVLPIDIKRVKTIIVGGPYADIAQIGTYSGTPTISPISPLTGISTLASKYGIKVKLMRSSEEKFTTIPTTAFSPDSDSGVSGLKAEYYNNHNFKGKPLATRVDKSIDYKWTKPLINAGPDIPQPVFAVRWTGTITAAATGTYQLRGLACDGMRVWIDGKQIFGKRGSRAVREIGRASIKMEAGHKYAIKVEYYGRGKQSEAHLEWIEPNSKDNILAGYDPSTTLAVYVCGSSDKLANESRDRKNIKLRKFEEDDIKELTERFSMTVVVLNGGGALAPIWASEHTPAILDSWYSGQEGGTALAELLFGKVSPSGRLPVTFYRSIDDLPAFGDYAVAGNGRTYKYFKGTPLWAFGHGLSYTTFKYGKPELSAATLESGDTLKVKITIENTGKHNGDEVVQLYVRKLQAADDSPVRELKAFQRISVKQGEGRGVELTTAVDDWSRWDTASNKWNLVPGEYEIEIGASSSDIRQKARVIIKKK